MGHRGENQTQEKKLTMAFLEVRNLIKDFGGLRANNNVSFSVEREELIGLIGPNGAGKTTLFNCISGLHTITSGQVIFDGEDITDLKAHEVARLGLARTFQVYVAAGDLTVLENVMVGCFMRTRSRAQAQKKAVEILADLAIEDLSNALVSELPVAAQKRVTMATAIGSGPKLLLLDEVAAGLNPNEIDGIMTSIRHVHDEMGITVILIEHVMELVMKVSHKLIVLDYGEKIAEGDPETVAKDPLVIKAYLGERYAETYGAPNS